MERDSIRRAYSQIKTIESVAEELNISGNDLPLLSENQANILAEFITVLAEVRRVTSQLEADIEVNLSRASL